MEIARRALARLALHAMQGEPNEARAYLGTMLPRSTPCVAIRKALAKALTPAGLSFMDSALPWLGEGTLGEVGAPAGELLDRLRTAGQAGIPRRECDAVELEALASEIAEHSVPTGGRPITIVRLREFDARFNPFAMPD